jgi:hypothetical protein
MDGSSLFYSINVYQLVLNGVKHTVLTEFRKNKEIFGDYYTNQKARPLNSKMANADTLEGAGVNSGNALDAAKLQNNVELSYRSGEKLYIRTKNFQNWFGKWEKNEQLSSKIAVKTAFYNLYRILVQLWLKAKKNTLSAGTGRAFVCFRASY